GAAPPPADLGPAVPSAVAGAPAATVVGGHDLAGQLQQLAALHTAGALTDEEYAAAKRRLISNP
ncbi:MAG: SHOCT domain-containing protein, partial [Solirubrobacteraceae bacterium]